MQFHKILVKNLPHYNISSYNGGKEDQDTPIQWGEKIGKFGPGSSCKRSPFKDAEPFFKKIVKSSQKTRSTKKIST